MKQKPTKNTRYLSRQGKVTHLLKQQLEEILKAHIEIAEFWAEKRGRPKEDYTIKEAHVTGSILRGNNLSDLDILLIGNKLDFDDYRFLKQVMAQLFYSNRDKISALDVYIRPYDEYPDRPSFEITPQVKSLLDKYNKELTASG